MNGTPSSTSTGIIRIGHSLPNSSNAGGPSSTRQVNGVAVS